MVPITPWGELMSPSNAPVAGLASLLEASSLAADDIGRVLRRLDDTSQLTLGGEWTVRETAVHVIGCLKLYAGVLDGKPSAIHSWDDLTVLNAAWFTMLDETNPSLLADMVVESAARYIQVAGNLTEQDQRPWHLGVELPVADIVTLMGNELLMHGWDIAVVTGNTVETGSAALSMIQGLSTLWPGFLRPDLGAGVRFGLGIDGRAPLVYVFGDNSVQLDPLSSTTDVDCITRGSALNHMLWISGRLDFAGAELTSSGTRPQLVESFGLPR